MMIMWVCWFQIMWIKYKSEQRVLMKDIQVGRSYKEKEWEHNYKTHIWRRDPEEEDYESVNEICKWEGSDIEKTKDNTWSVVEARMKWNI